MLEELDEDIREHIARETQDNIERGMRPEEARYAAVRKFGNVTRLKEETREVWSMVWLEQLLQDIRFGLRMLRNSPPGFAAVANSHLGPGDWREHGYFQLDRRGTAAVVAGGESFAISFTSGGKRATRRTSTGICLREIVRWRTCGPGLRIRRAAPSPSRWFREIAQSERLFGTAAFCELRQVDHDGNGPATVINGQLVSGDFFRTMGLKRPQAGYSRSRTTRAASARCRRIELWLLAERVRRVP